MTAAIGRYENTDFHVPANEIKSVRAGQNNGKDFM